MPDRRPRRPRRPPRGRRRIPKARRLPRRRRRRKDQEEEGLRRRGFPDAALRPEDAERLTSLQRSRRLLEARDGLADPPEARRHRRRRPRVGPLPRRRLRTRLPRRLRHPRQGLPRHPLPTARRPQRRRLGTSLPRTPRTRKSGLPLRRRQRLPPTTTPNHTYRHNRATHQHHTRLRVCVCFFCVRVLVGVGRGQDKQQKERGEAPTFIEDEVDLMPV
mmetsp:Transcript_16247/g.52894  ORF Transcript_16247/g.52894 Transcript_16247/m.52894 type:complete len:218 (-) Transcript_16247:351-1004(-)